MEVKIQDPSRNGDHSDYVTGSGLWLMKEQAESLALINPGMWSLLLGQTPGTMPALGYADPVFLIQSPTVVFAGGALLSVCPQ